MNSLKSNAKKKNESQDTAVPALARKPKTIIPDTKLTSSAFEKSELLNLEKEFQEPAFMDSVNTRTAAPARNNYTKPPQQVVPVNLTRKAVEAKKFRPKVDGSVPLIRLSD